MNHSQAFFGLKLYKKPRGFKYITLHFYRNVSPKQTKDTKLNERVNKSTDPNSCFGVVWFIAFPKSGCRPDSLGFFGTVICTEHTELCY